MRAMPTAMLPVATTYRPPFRPRGRHWVPVPEYDRQVWGGELSAADDADGSLCRALQSDPHRASERRHWQPQFSRSRAIGTAD